MAFSWIAPATVVMSVAATAAIAVAGTTNGADRAAYSPRSAAAGKAPTRAAAIGTPAQASPRDSARVEAVPPFSWRGVRRAAKYEFQLSADGAFRSVVERGSFSTRNTFGTVEKTLADGNYFWRTRAIDSRDRAGKWSKRRSVAKRWVTRPTLLAPVDGASVAYPAAPLVLRWDPVPHAYKYRVTVATDPSLATSLVGTAGRPVETQGTVFSVPVALAPGARYYWAVTPLDAAGHPGTRSAVGSFVWAWDSSTTPQIADVHAAAEVNDQRFSWTRVPGAALYDVEISTSPGFAPGSEVCCNEKVIGTSLTPTRLLPNNDGSDTANSGYYWRVRALDVNGNPGAWNVGPPFSKEYDTIDPSIRDLRVRDNVGDPLTPASPPIDLDPTTDFLDTSSPIVTWSPVPGASSYHVRVVPWGSLGCQWSTTGSESWGVSTTLATASTSWSPLGASQPSPVDTGSPPVSVQSENARAVDGNGYCARVTARSGTDTKNGRVLGKSIELGNLAKPAFRYRAPVGPPSPTPVMMSASDYFSPSPGSTTPRVPLFTWRAKAGVCGYFVVVAHDQAFTKVIDVARTLQPSYAPRLRTYPDDSADYYWAVLPIQQDPDNPGSCTIVPTRPSDNSPQAFRKLSVPPSPLEPADDEQLTTQPRFHWSGAEAAREYRLQVSRDPNFQDGRLLLDDVTTAATAYTSAATYPADARVYWRVRANDENETGLNWSATRSFQRSLPAPAPDTGNPTAGEHLPVLSWDSVPGAVSYDLHVDWVDGHTSDFTLRSTAFTPVIFYGSGVWSWQVRANFPGAPGRTVSGPYSSRRQFTRFLGPPTGARSTRSKKNLLVSWDPSRAARRYRVQFSETNSFTRTIDRADIENTSYAPRLTQPGFLDGGPIYWRVAVIDEGNNLGAWATGQVKLLRRMVVTVDGTLYRRKRGTVRVTVKDAKGRAVRGARVTPRGAGVSRKARRTGNRGVATLRLRPQARAGVRFRVDKSGYGPGSVTVRVR